MFDLTGKKALVTGSARGLGNAVAMCLAQAGADVVVNYVSDSSREPAETLAKAIRDLGKRSLVVQGDVGSEEDVKRMMATIEQEFGGVDILVNNAGINSDRNIDTLDLEEYQRILTCASRNGDASS